MNVTMQYDILSVRAIPATGGNTNVISIVQWEVGFSADGIESKGGGLTLLDTENIPAFVPYTDVTKEMLWQWVVSKEGGEDFTARLNAIHSSVLAKKKAEAASVPLTLGFEKPKVDYTGGRLPPGVLMPVSL
jgi:hypothetical protein